MPPPFGPRLMPPDFGVSPPSLALSTFPQKAPTAAMGGGQTKQAAPGEAGRPPPGDPGGGAGGPALPRSAVAPEDAETDPCAGKTDPLAGEIDQIPGKTDQVPPAPGNGAGGRRRERARRGREGGFTGKADPPVPHGTGRAAAAAAAASAPAEKLRGYR